MVGSLGTRLCVRGIAVSGTYAFVADGCGAPADHRRQRSRGARARRQRRHARLGLRRVRLREPTPSLRSGDAGLQIIDVGNPAAPSLVGELRHGRVRRPRHGLRTPRLRRGRPRRLSSLSTSATRASQRLPRASTTRAERKQRRARRGPRVRRRSEPPVSRSCARPRRCSDVAWSSGEAMTAIVPAGLRRPVRITCARRTRSPRRRRSPTPSAPARDERSTSGSPPGCRRSRAAPRRPSSGRRSPGGWRSTGTENSSVRARGTRRTCCCRRCRRISRFSTIPPPSPARSRSSCCWCRRGTPESSACWPTTRKRPTPCGRRSPRPAGSRSRATTPGTTRS